ncbi:MAG: hypothetical protein M1816_005143 [Peltula sp. TS41687]|nr:MAG: hypothetical protein M1816_005143 [Peltula sp. TS41687]
MADTRPSTDGPSPLSPAGHDPSSIPDFHEEFLRKEDLAQFSKALSAPENIADDVASREQSSSFFFTALNDWRPIHQRVRRKVKPARGKDETREGFVYTLLKWPLLFLVSAWIVVLSTWYMLTRLYVWFYETYVTWRGKRERLRRKLQSANNYAEWLAAAKELDKHLVNEEWKSDDEYAYYDAATIRSVKEQMRETRERAEAEETEKVIKDGSRSSKAVDELRDLLQACVKANFAGMENPRLYAQTYHGTKNNLQEFVNEVETSLLFLQRIRSLSPTDKRTIFRHLHTNLGRTALCLSGGATFAYYHFGVAKALIDADLLPQVISGTSGGALVAALIATRTDHELKRLLVPALAGRITACHDNFWTWVRRLYRTGARFDSLEWARHCSWFTRGSLTFREAYERTGRILNVTCVPSDPHSPTILANYLTSPDCVIWSAVLASAAVPGILSPVVLMMKTRDGTLTPYSFGHKWKDGSLRTDIPLKALNLQFNVHFSIVSQCNPHIKLFVFKSRGDVGRPVTHRRGRGWRGGFLGSAIEQYIKLDLNKWLRVLRYLELLPRPLGQDWSEVWLQRFSGTVTIWPKSILSDFYYILSDPTPQRLARMIRAGQQATFPKLKFISNRMRIERLVDEGRRTYRLTREDSSDLYNYASDDEPLLNERITRDGHMKKSEAPRRPTPEIGTSTKSPPSYKSPSSSRRRPERSSQSLSPTLTRHLSSWWSSSSSHEATPQNAKEKNKSSQDMNESSSKTLAGVRRPPPRIQRSGSVLSEIGRQSRVLFDDDSSPPLSNGDDSTETDEDIVIDADDHVDDDDHFVEGNKDKDI